VARRPTAVDREVVVGGVITIAAMVIVTSATRGMVS